MVNKKDEVENMESSRFWAILGLIAVIILTLIMASQIKEMDNLKKNANHTVVYTTVRENLTIVNNYLTNETFVNVSVYPQYNITIEKDKIWIHLHEHCSADVLQNITNDTQSNTTFTQNNTNTYNNASNETVYVCEEDKGHKNKTKKKD